MRISNIYKYFENEDEMLDIYGSLLNEGLSSHQAAEVMAANVGACSATIVNFLKFMGAYEKRKIKPTQFSFEAYCSDDYTLIENYEQAKAANFKGWCIHHRLETHKYKDRSRTEWVQRDENVSRLDLIDFDLYYKRPAKELIFMTTAEHLALHSKGQTWGHKKGVLFTESHKQSLKEAWQKRKIEHPVSAETRRKMSESAKKRWQKAS